MRDLTNLNLNEPLKPEVGEVRGPNGTRVTVIHRKSGYRAAAQAEAFDGHSVEVEVSHTAPHSLTIIVYDENMDVVKQKGFSSDAWWTWESEPIFILTEEEAAEEAAAKKAAREAARRVKGIPHQDNIFAHDGEDEEDELDLEDDEDDEDETTYHERHHNEPRQRGF